MESGSKAKGSHNQLPDSVEPLTERELEILRLLANGWTDREIAEHLVLALETIKWYNKRVYGKLSVSNRTQAAARAAELGLLGPAQDPVTRGFRHNLPAATTPFIGRDLELNELADLLASGETRLITILAPGGMGKTRVALEVARTQIELFSNGVCFIPLVQLRATGNIIPTIAKQLGVQLSASADPEAQLSSFLLNKELLLVLDNFEHLLDGADVITMLLQTAPGIKVVVTSRERLNLRGETVYPLGGMRLPMEEASSETLKCSAIKLFIQHAQMARADFSLPESDLPYVTKICRQVWGMPLGIELAASLVGVLSAQEIAAEIEHSFDILATEMRDMPHRLRSVRAVFDYSWSRLSDIERYVYMRLAVFRGGFTREAAQVVADANLSLLIRLVNKSLLQREPGRRRYVLHELLRQYAEEQLEASGSAEAVYKAHTTYYTDLLARSEDHVKGHKQLETLDEIEADFENFRAAWERAIEQADLDTLAESLEALYWFCNMRGRVPDGRLIFQAARARFASPSDPDAHPVQYRFMLRFDASGETYGVQLEQVLALVRERGDKGEVAFFLWALGVNAYVARDFGKARVILSESLELYRSLGDTFYATELLHLLGMCSRFVGETEAANEYERQVRKLSRETGNKFALARALGSQGLLATYYGNDAQAKSDIQEALDIRRALGDSAGVAMSLSSLSTMAFFQGNFSKANTLAKESLELASSVNSVNSRTTALNALGWLAVVEENYTEARLLCEESLALSPDPTVTFGAHLGLALAACGLDELDTARHHALALLNSYSLYYTTRGMLSCLLVMAVLYAHQHKMERAVEVLALAFAHPSNAIPWMEKWPLLRRLRDRLETSLGSDRFAAAWERGTGLELEKVVNEWLGS